jgi:FKBP-type peptidyl-prolyl cis-trans isomerase FklB
MTLRSLFASLAISLVAAHAAAQGAPQPFKTPLEATGYAVGVDMIRSFKEQNVPIDIEQVIRGLKDASAGGKLLLPDAEVRRLVSELEVDVRRKMVAARKIEGETNLKKSEEFMKANATKPGVISLPSGLQYQVVKTGTGAKAKDDATVTANYRGTLIDGTEFDASAAGKPATFKVAGLIPGWREALKLMPAGSKWQLFIPPALAYGDRGAGRLIGPNQALRFELELVEIK